MNHKNCNFKFSSKAETLHALQQHDFSFHIPELLHFTTAEWAASKVDIIDQIRSKLGNSVAVRSSASAEDRADSSMAGAFESILNVNTKDTSEVTKAVQAVIASYKGSAAAETDRVLVQKMSSEIILSGVVMTRIPDSGANYYVFNYDDESGLTDTVTSGQGDSKTILVFRDAKEEYCDSPRVKAMLHFTRELEDFFGEIPIDIEFGIDARGKVHLFQVRPIATTKNWRTDLVLKVMHAGGVALQHDDSTRQHKSHLQYIEKFLENYLTRRNGLYGKTTILSNMADWNPAEIIGADPSPLASSLYRYIITAESWSVARAKMGYHTLPRSDLMVMLGGSPYIDTRLSFNSFLPCNLDKEASEKLVNAWTERLYAKPFLHDKIEFEIAHTIYDFNFEHTFKERYDGVLSQRQASEYSKRLLELTKQNLNFDDGGSLKTALYEIEVLATYQKQGKLKMPIDNPVQLAAWLNVVLSDCIRYGTVPFSIIARHGFIAEAMLRSAAERGALTVKRVDEFKASFSTILSELTKECSEVIRGDRSSEEFLEKYGHLRPGTYDIMSRSYRETPNVFNNTDQIGVKLGHKNFKLTSAEESSLSSLFLEIGLGHINANSFLQYFICAVRGREYAKFVFTKNLSAALDGVAEWGKHWGFSREELSYLTIEEILSSAYTSSQDLFSRNLGRQIEYAQIERQFNRELKLGGVICDIGDIYVVPIQRAEANFVTNKRVEGECILLDNSTEHSLAGKIVCIEGADPGYDWIFVQNIAGLITRYGGTNSHMAIRCAELGLPAAIGCGESAFASLVSGKKIGLYCDERTIRKL